MYGMHDPCCKWCDISRSVRPYWRLSRLTGWSSLFSLFVPWLIILVLKIGMLWVYQCCSQGESNVSTSSVFLWHRCFQTSNPGSILKEWCLLIMFKESELAHSFLKYNLHQVHIDAPLPISECIFMAVLVFLCAKQRLEDLSISPNTLTLQMPIAPMT